MVSVEGIDARKWNQIQPVYQEFLEREIDSAEALEQWLLELGQFDAFVGETGSMLYVEMTCDTENEEIKQAYLDFVEEVQPELAKVGDLLNRKLADSPHADALDSVEYNVLLRDTRMDLALFREENIALGTELTKLGQRYNEICGAMNTCKSMTVRSGKVPIGRSVNADSKTLKKSTNCSTKWLGSVIR